MEIEAALEIMVAANCTFPPTDTELIEKHHPECVEAARVLREVYFPEGEEN